VRRVIAGRFGQGKSGAAGDDAAVDYGEYRTYLWIRRGAVACSSATAGAGEFMSVALAGQTALGSAVEVLRDEERVVPVLADGTVLVWRWLLVSR
jgi:predicted nucleic acid-binding protein